MKNNYLTAHFSSYLYGIRQVFLIIAIVVITNALIQVFTMSVLSGEGLRALSLMSLLSPLWGVTIGTIIAVPIMQVTTNSHLLMHGSRRIDILFSNIMFNLLTTTIVASLVTVLIYIFSAPAASSLPIYVMGNIIEQLTLVGWIAIFVVIYAVLYFFVSSIHVIALVFNRFSLLFGFASIFVYASIVAFAANYAFMAYMWGAYSVELLISVIIAILANTLISWHLMLRFETFSPSYKWSQALALIAAVALFALAFQLNFSANEDAPGHYERGMFQNLQFSEHYNDFTVTEDNQYFYINWRAIASDNDEFPEGHMVISIYNPSNELVYSQSANHSEITKVPVTPGQWRYSIIVKDIYKGEFSFQGLLN